MAPDSTNEGRKNIEDEGDFNDRHHFSGKWSVSDNILRIIIYSILCIW